MPCRLLHMVSQNIIISLVDYVKLLGVTFDKYLNFDKHIANVCSSSYYISVLSAIFAFFLTQKLPMLLLVPD